MPFKVTDLLYAALSEERLRIPVSVILTPGVVLAAVDAQVDQAVPDVPPGGHVRPTVCQGRVFVYNLVHKRGRDGGGGGDRFYHLRFLS